MARKFTLVAYDLGELHSGLHVFVETRDLDFTSAGTLLDKFNADIEPDEPLTAKPLAMVLNPEKDGRRYLFSSVVSDVWLVVFRGNFCVVVEKNIRTMTGPHVAKLKYKSYQTGQIFWIATMQIENCMFFSEDQIQMYLHTQIMRREWYISPKSRKDIIAV